MSTGELFSLSIEGGTKNRDYIDAEDESDQTNREYLRETSFRCFPLYSLLDTSSRSYDLNWMTSPTRIFHLDLNCNHLALVVGIQK